MSSAAPVSTHRQVWTLAWPIIVANVTVPLLGAVDTAVVGHLPEPYYIGAVAIGAMLFNYIYHLFNCLRMGTTGPTAQARGAGEHAEVRAMIARALLLAGVIGGVIVALQLPIVAFAFWLINASAEVERYAREYFLIRVWSMPAVLATYAIFGWFYGLRNVKLPLAIQVFVNVVNIALAVLFVFVFKWGVPGVAAASLIAEYAGLLWGLYGVWRTLGELPRENTSGTPSKLLDPVQLQRMVAINSDIVLRTICVVSVLGFFMAKSAELGDVQLAANQVLHHFLIFTSFALDGVAQLNVASSGSLLSIPFGLLLSAPWAEAELARVRQFGFGESELERQKKSLLASYERAFNERDKSESPGFASELVGLYLNGDPTPGIAAPATTSPMQRGQPAPGATVVTSKTPAPGSSTPEVSR